MPTLHVRNVPARLYERLRRSARARNRSLTAEVLTLLDRGVEGEAIRRSQTRLLANIRRRRRARTLPPRAPSSVTLLRQDRRR